MRHRKEAVDPTDKLAVFKLQYHKEHEGLPTRDRLPDGYDPGNYDAYRDHDAFCTMVKAFIKDETFDIQGIIYTYWRLGFKRPFPKEGGSLLQLCTMIRLKLLHKGFERNEIVTEDPKECIVKRFPHLIPHKFTNYKIYSQPTEEVMGKSRKDEDKDDKKKKGKRKKSYTRDDEDDELDDRKDRKSKDRKKKKGDDSDDKDKKKKKKKKKTDSSGQCRIMCAELLMKRKYTDEQISEMIEDEIGEKYSPARVNRIREGINNGVREKQGIPAPKPPLEEIVKGGKKKSSRDDDDDRKDRKKKDKKKKRHHDEDDD
jgi:hypothetical protein